MIFVAKEGFLREADELKKWLDVFAHDLNVIEISGDHTGLRRAETASEIVAGYEGLREVTGSEGAILTAQVPETLNLGIHKIQCNEAQAIEVTYK